MSRALTIAEAAEDLRVSRRWLEYWLADHPVDAAGTPFYVPMGRRKTFEDADIARIRAVIREEERCRLHSIGVKAAGSTVIAEQLARLVVENSFKVPAKPKTKILRRVRCPKSKPTTGNVISMAQGRS
jgi:hypothetical protein